jgi:hypothetical protein
MDLVEKDGERHDFCWTSAALCERKRDQIVTEKLGTATPCVPEPVAHCAIVTDSEANTWQAYCARTTAGCEAFRKALRRHPPYTLDKIGACQPSRNVAPDECMRVPPPASPAGQ